METKFFTFRELDGCRNQRQQRSDVTGSPRLACPRLGPRNRLRASDSRQVGWEEGQGRCVKKPVPGPRTPWRHGSPLPRAEGPRASTHGESRMRLLPGDLSFPAALLGQRAPHGAGGILTRDPE